MWPGLVPAAGTEHHAFDVQGTQSSDAASDDATVCKSSAWAAGTLRVTPQLICFNSLWNWRRETRQPSNPRGAPIEALESKVGALHGIRGPIRPKRSMGYMHSFKSRPVAKALRFGEHSCGGGGGLCDDVVNILVIVHARPFVAELPAC